MEEATKSWPIARFARPDGLTRVAIDPWTGLLADKGGESVDEWFINGTQPKHPLAANTCGVDVLLTPDVGFESRYDNWMKADRDWIRRAEKGPGTAGGPDRTRTAYFYNPTFHPYGRSWGALVDRRGLRAEPEPEPILHPIADPGCKRRDPVARGADAGPVGRARPGLLPATVGDAGPVGGADAHARADTDTRAHADADPHPDAGTHADAHTDPAPGTASSAAARRIGFGRGRLASGAWTRSSPSRTSWSGALGEISSGRSTGRSAPASAGW